MIYYDIQHHGDTEQLKWLSTLLDDKDNIINFSLDIDTNRVNDFKHWVSKREFSAKVSVTKSIPVTWCGPSNLDQIRNMLDRAIKVEGWEYFINLSGVCFPLKSQIEIKQRLLAEKQMNKHTSFCFGFKPKKDPVWIENNDRDASYSYHNYNYFRLKMRCSQRVIDAFEHEGFDPVRNVMDRRAVHFAETGENKKLILRGLEAWEIRGKITFWSQHDYIVGRAWVILHRKQVEWLTRSSYTQTIYDHLNQTFVSDESFLPTLLFSEQNPYRDELSKNNFRYNLGAPSVIDDVSLAQVLDDDSLFARKLSRDISQSGLKKIESKMAAHPSETLFKLIDDHDTKENTVDQLHCFQNTLEEYEFKEFRVAEENNKNSTLQLLFYVQKKNIKKLTEIIKSLLSEDTLILKHLETDVKTTAVYSLSYNGISNFIFFRADDNSNPWILVQKDRFIEAIIVPGRVYVFSKTKKFIEFVFSKLLKKYNINDCFSKDSSSSFRGIIIGDKRPFHFFYDKFRMIKAFEDEIISTRKHIYEFSNVCYFSIKEAYPQLNVVYEKENGIYISPVLAGDNSFYQNKISKDYYVLANKMEERLYDSALVNVSNKCLNIINTKNVNIWIGITGQKRSWVEQIEGYANIINKLKDENGEISVMIDGMTAPYNQIIQNTDDLNVYDQIVSRLNNQVKVINLIGLDYKRKIQYCHFADFFIANAGTGCFVPLRVCKKPGVLHSNKTLFAFPDKYPDYIQHIPVEDITDLPNPGSDKSMNISYSIDWRIVYEKLEIVMIEYNKVRQKVK